MDGFITRVWTFQQKLDWYASENREQALRTMHASMTKRMSHAMLQSMQTIGRNWDMELPTKMRDLQQSERCAPTPSMQLQVQIADIKAMKWTLICLELCILTLNHPIPLCPHRGIGTGSSANHNQAKKKRAPNHSETGLSLNDLKWDAESQLRPRMLELCLSQFSSS